MEDDLTDYRLKVNSTDYDEDANDVVENVQKNVRNLNTI